MSIRHRIRSTQPQNFTAVNWANPITSRLAALLNGAIYAKTSPTNLALENVTSWSEISPESANKLITTKGISPNFTNISSGLLKDMSSGGQLSGDFTCLALIIKGATTGSNYIFSLFGTQANADIYLSGASTVIQSVYDINFTSAPNVASFVGAVGTVGFLGLAYTASNKTFRLICNNQIVSTTNGALTSFDITKVEIASYSLNKVPFLAVWRRALSTTEIKSLSDNPWQLFATDNTPLFSNYSNTDIYLNQSYSDQSSNSSQAVAVTIEASVFKPGSDVVTTGWTAVPGPTIAAQINESSADDNTYIRSPNVASPNPVTMTWSSPVAAGTYDIAVRYRHNGIARQIRLVLLDAGTAVVGISAWIAPSSTLVQQQIFNVTTTGTSTSFRIEVQ